MARVREIAVDLAAGTAVAAVILAGGAWLAAPATIRIVARAELAAAGVPAARLEVTRLSLDGLTAEGIALGPGIRIDRLEATWRLSRLMRERRLDRLVIEGLHIEAAFDPDGGLVLEGIDPPAGAAEGPTALPADLIEIDGGSLAVATPVGPLSARFALVARMSGGGIVVEGSFDPAPDGDASTGSFEARLDGQGAFAASLALDAEEVAAGEVRLHDAALVLTADAGAGRPVSIRGSLEAAGLTARGGSLADVFALGELAGATGSASLRARLPEGAGDLRADATLAPEAAGRRPVGVAVDLDARSLTPLLGLAGLAGGGSGRLTADLSGTLGPAGARPALSGPLHIRAEGLAVEGGPTGADADIAATLEVAEGWGAAALGATAPWRLAGTPPGRADRIEATATDAHLAATLTAEGIATRFTAAIQAAGLGARLGGLIDATASKGRLDLALADASASLASGATAEGIAAELAVEPAAGAVAGTYGVDRVQLAAGLPPLRVVGQAARGEDGAIGFEGHAVAAGGALDIGFSGSHNPATGGGAVEATAAPVSFAPGVRQPADIVPRLAAALPLAEVTGTIRVAGRAAWGQGLETSGSLALDGLDFLTPFAAVTGLRGTLTASSLLPIILPRGQRLRAARVDFGLPLEDGEAIFGLDARGRLAVAQLAFRFAGGRLWAEPFTLAGGAPGLVVLRAEEIDLAGLVANLPMRGLTATGRLSGSVPIRLGDDTIAIEDGLLASTVPGSLAYAPDRAPALPGVEAASYDLLMQAVRNFRYESLELGLAGRLNDDVTVAVRIRGANPDVYDGYPIALNVNLEGRLGEILLNSLAASRFGARAEEYYRRRAAAAVGAGVIDRLQRIQE